MNISKLALISLLGSALAAFGCSDDNGGNGGNGGGGNGGGIPECVDSGARCENTPIDPITACCEPEPGLPPVQTDACTGDESVENPASCTATGTTTTYRLTLMEIAGDCNTGYDLDSCVGDSCANGALAPKEGEMGVDNALAGLAGVAEGAGGNINGVNQAFSDALCGITNDPTKGICDGGADDGDACVLVKECEGGDNAGADCSEDEAVCTGDGGKCVDLSNAGCDDVKGTCSVTVATECVANGECPSGETCDDADVGTCDLDNDDCLLTGLPPLEILFVVDADAANNCANVTVVSGGVAGDPVPVNLTTPSGSDTACLSGTLGSIPLSLAGIEGAFANAILRTTVSAAGFSDGILSATMDQATAGAIADTLIEGGAGIVASVLDINSDLSGNVVASCDALSATLSVGGSTEEGAGGAGGNGGGGAGGGGQN